MNRKCQDNFLKDGQKSAQNRLKKIALKTPSFNWIPTE